MTDANAAIDVPKGHPPGLYMMFFAELWERFCYYGMRALLAVYVAQLFMVEQKEASLIYGTYAALVYATGTFGGYLADKYLGFRRAILLGGLIMAAGEFLLVLYDQSAFLYGLSLIVIGNGLFKPNISSLVGKLYKENDPRRDSGFTIFYMGINVGAMIAPVLCAGISNWFPIDVPLDQLAPGMQVKPEWTEAGMASLPDYRWGFGLAGIGMLIGLVTFWFGQGTLGDKGLPPAHRKGLAPIGITLLGCAAIAPLVKMMLDEKDVTKWILVALSLVVLGIIAYTAMKEFGAGNKAVGQRMIVLIILLFANMVFWSSFEQAGNSLNFFARDHVNNPDWFSFENFQSVNPVYIILLGPVFAWLWVKLDKANVNPSIPAKFGLGLIQVGLGFGIAVMAIGMAGDDYRTPFVLMFVVYLLHTMGELCLSPVGLSMVTKLAPASMTGFVMGAWFLSIAMANLVAGMISSMAASLDEDKLEAGLITGGDALEAYSGAYGFLLWYSIGVGVLLLVFAKPLNKLMNGIK